MALLFFLSKRTLIHMPGEYPWKIIRVRIGHRSKISHCNTLVQFGLYAVDGIRNFDGITLFFSNRKCSDARKRANKLKNNSLCLHLSRKMKQVVQLLKSFPWSDASHNPLDPLI
jgi:hypothetical protein